MRFDQRHRSTKVKEHRTSEVRRDKIIETRMKVAQVLHMNGGVGHASYANNSLVQVYLYIQLKIMLPVFIYPIKK